MDLQPQLTMLNENLVTLKSKLTKLNEKLEALKITFKQQLKLTPAEIKDILNKYGKHPEATPSQIIEQLKKLTKNEFQAILKDLGYDPLIQVSFMGYFNNLTKPSAINAPKKPEETKLKTLQELINEIKDKQQKGKLYNPELLKEITDKFDTSNLTESDIEQLKKLKESTKVKTQITIEKWLKESGITLDAHILLNLTREIQELQNKLLPQLDPKPEPVQPMQTPKQLTLEEQVIKIEKNVCSGNYSLTDFAVKQVENFTKETITQRDFEWISQFNIGAFSDKLKNEDPSLNKRLKEQLKTLAHPSKHLRSQIEKIQKAATTEDYKLTEWAVKQVEKFTRKTIRESTSDSNWLSTFNIKKFMETLEDSDGELKERLSKKLEELKPKKKHHHSKH